MFSTRDCLIDYIEVAHNRVAPKFGLIGGRMSRVGLFDRGAGENFAPSRDTLTKTTTRHLAAILAADVAGYSRLMRKERTSGSRCIGVSSSIQRLKNITAGS
jgi:hypothetical protein